MSTYYELNIEMQEKQAAIRFCLHQKSDVLLRVMNADDKEVRLLINETMPEGKHSTLFSFGNLEPDEYIIRLLINREDAIDIETLNIKIN
jgi:hypothetical protein